MTVKRFRDFADTNDGPLSGKKVKIDEILDQELLFINYRIKSSKFGKNVSGKYLTLQFQKELDESSNSERNVVFTGSDVLISQLEKYGNQLPFIAKISKIDGKYYTLN